MLRLTALAVCCTLALGACSPKDSASNQAQTASASAAQTEGASLTVKTARGDAKVPQIQSVSPFTIWVCSIL